MVGMEGLPTLDEIANLSGRDLEAALWAAERVRRGAEAVIASVVARCDSSLHYLADGHRSVKQWTMAMTNCSPHEARLRRGTARVFDLMPGARAGMLAAPVGVAQVHELARLAANPRCREHLPASEHVLLDAARTLPFPDFRRVVAHWESLAEGFCGRAGGVPAWSGWCGRSACVPVPGGRELGSEALAVAGSV